MKHAAVEQSLFSQSIIPAFFSIDVEPTGFQLSSTVSRGWDGYHAIAEAIEALRSDLRKNSGSTPRFGWYFRTDPQIGEIFGTQHFAMTHAPELVNRAKKSGDYFGIHPHPLRWSPREQTWIHEFEDQDWLLDCINHSIEVYENWANESVTRTRFGAGFLNNQITSAFDRAGVAVDLTLEPVPGRNVATKETGTIVDSSPITGSFLDCGAAPQHPYHPSAEDFRLADHGRSLGIIMLPLSTVNYADLEPYWKKCARLALNKPAWQKPKMLFMWDDWGSAKNYWDIVERTINRMKQPYLSLAIRTDKPDSVTTYRVRKLFEALPQHPLAKRLRFVDPAEIANELI